MVAFSASSVPTHNGLGGLQGGTTDEYYHLTADKYTDLTNAVLSFSGSIGGTNSIYWTVSGTNYHLRIQ